MSKETSTLSYYTLLLSDPNTPEDLKKKIQETLIPRLPDSYAILSECTVDNSAEEALIISRIELFSRVCKEAKKFNVHEFSNLIAKKCSKIFNLIPGRTVHEKNAYISKVFSKYPALRSSNPEITIQRFVLYLVFHNTLGSVPLQVSVQAQVEEYQKQFGTLPKINFESEDEHPIPPIT